MSRRRRSGAAEASDAYVAEADVGGASRGALKAASVAADAADRNIIVSR